MNKWAPHPKHEPFKLNRPPLNEKQQRQQFIHTILNLQHLHPSPSKKQSNSQQYLTIAQHLLAPPSEIVTLISKKEKKTKEKSKADVVQDITLTEQDEESEYQSYLKQYTTVVKKSRKKEYVSPQAQKEQMEELITEFLSGGPEIQGKAQQVHNHRNKSMDKTKSIGKKQNIQMEGDPSIRVERIDLNQIKPKTSLKSHKHHEKETEKKKDMTPTKYIDITSYQKNEVNSPKFTESEKSETKEKAARKNKTPIKIEVVRVQDIREKKQKPAVIVYSPINLMKESDKQKSNSYSIAYRPTQKESYLKNNHHKTMKQSPKLPLSQEHSQKVSNESSRIHKKPIKIEIQIPLEDSQEPLDIIKNTKDISIQSSNYRFGEERQIIKQVSQKVLALIQKNKHLTTSK